MPNSLEDIASDLAPAEKVIEVGPNRKKLTLRGLDAGQIAGISGRYPEFGKFLDTARDARNSVPDDPDGDAATQAIRSSARIGDVMGLGGGAYPAMIAASIGRYNDVEAERIAATFAFEHQASLVGEIMALTFSQSAPRPLADADGNLDV